MICTRIQIIILYSLTKTSNNNFEGVVQDRNKEIFQKAAPVYFEALEKSGFNECLYTKDRYQS